MKLGIVLLLALGAGIVLDRGAKPVPVAAYAGHQQGPPSAPPSTAPPSEPVQLHAPPPHRPADFEGPRQHTSPRSHPDSAKTRQDAQELAALADKIPGEVDQISKGTLPKDVTQQLKEIRKLAKRLEEEITP